jgi:hypothetical protein
VAIHTAQARPSLAPQISREVVGVLLSCVLVALSAVSIDILGFWALALPFYAGLAVLVAVSPSSAALVTLALGIAFEPDAIDASRPVSMALYRMPPALANVLPITISPLEALILAIAVALALHPPRRAESPPALPRLVLAVPCFFLSAFVYGLWKGGNVHIGYQEARGLLYGAVAFVIARRLWGVSRKGPLAIAFVGTCGLACIVLSRYFFITRNGTSGIPVEVAYAHEDAIFLASGFILGCALLLQGGNRKSRVLLLGYNLLVLAAVFATGRRAGMLVLFVGVIMLAWMTLRPRPRLAVALGVPLLAGFGLYLTAYWNQPYGALAQPARAVRSQVDPTARDESSDLYRDIEKFDVKQSILANPVMGVGFGREFIQYRPLPPLTSFWPLQLYTPHTNVLWLWLKLGLLGFSVILAVWVLAFRRCLLAFRQRVEPHQLPALPVLLACILLMYFSNAQVDLVLVGTRSAALLAVAMALSLSLPLKSPFRAVA